MSLLRGFLPGEYGLATGFIAYREGETVRLTSQLDIVIYDALRSGPLARLATCDVFPIEAVYGYVEVKASLASTSDDAKEKARNSIEACIETNRALRRLSRRTYWRPVPGTTVRSIQDERPWLPVRGYVVAFSAEGEVAATPPRMAQRIADYSARVGDAHLHGVMIAGSAFYWTRASEANAPKSEQHHVYFTTASPLGAFKADLLHGLARFPRFPADWTPAIDIYGEEPQWQSAAPTLPKMPVPAQGAPRSR